MRRSPAPPPPAAPAAAGAAAAPTAPAAAAAIAVTLAVGVAAAALAGCGDDDGAPPDAAAPDAGADAAPSGPDASTLLGGAVSGRVVSGGEGVPGAIVKFGGRPESTLTDPDGTFTLVVGEPPVDLARLGLTAGRAGYFSAGLRVVDPAAPQVIVLEPIELVDDPSYAFKSPDAANAAPYCLHCHPNQLQPWSASAHAEAARDPTLHDLYNGTASGYATEAACLAAGGTWRTGKALGAPAAVGKCYVDGGLLGDLNPGVCGGAGQPTCDDPGAPPEARPTATGPCADCHAPAGTAHAPGATNLNDVAGIAFEKGVHCDFCHKIANVVVNERPGVDGAIELLRPGPPVSSGFSDPEIMFGPYSDVIVFIMGGTPQPQFRTSELCSGCHQWSEPGFRAEDKPLVPLAKWPDGLPIQDTWHEWAASPWATQGAQCQHCHMPSAPFENATVDFGPIPPEPSGTRGWPRPYGEVRDHAFAARLPDDPTWLLGPGDPPRDLLRAPLDVAVTATRAGGELAVEVALTNVGAGHSIPTGTPSRQWILLVRAEGPGGPIEAIRGQTVPGWTGAAVEARLGPGEATLAGTTLTLPPGATYPATVGPGAVVRFATPTGEFADDPGTRWFGAPGRTPADKGLEIVEPAATATIVAVAGGTATLDRALALPDGTLVYVGAPEPEGPLAVDDALAVSPLAGAPGWVFGKAMVDRDGRRGVPFFRAIDIAADNRIPAGATARTRHVFDAAGAAGAPVTVTAILLYRKHPYPLARERGWPSVDVVRAVVTAVVAP